MLKFSFILVIMLLANLRNVEYVTYFQVNHNMAQERLD